MSKNPSIDLLKGVLILLVMGGHVMELTGGQDTVLWVGSGFRMPLMIGISGYLLNVTRTRSAETGDLLERYGRRMLLPWAFATILYLLAGNPHFSWSTPFDLLLRPPYHLWYVPVLFFLIMVTRVTPWSPLTLLALGAPFSLAVMYGYGLTHGPLGPGPLALDSRFLRYPLYFFFGMLLAERAQGSGRWRLALLVALLGLLWWAGLRASGNNLAYVPARLLMCLGLIALLPALSAVRLNVEPLNGVGRDSLFFYLWHPLVMGIVVTTGVGALATLAISILLLAVGGRLAARRPLTALLLGSAPERNRPVSAPPSPLPAA